MEHNKNIAVLKAAFGLAGKEAAVLAALLGGMAYAQDLEAACGVASRGALRKHMTRLREKLPRGGVTSRRQPTRYRLTDAAVQVCLEALGKEKIYHQGHQGHQGVGDGSGRPGEAGRLGDLGGLGGRASRFGPEDFEGASRPGAPR